MKKELAVLWVGLTLLLVVGAFLIGYKLMKDPANGSNQNGTNQVTSESTTEPSAAATETAIQNDTTALTEEQETENQEAADTETATVTNAASEDTVTYPEDYSFVMSGYVNTKQSNLMMRIRPDADAPCVFDAGIERGTPVEVYGSGMGSDGTMWYFVKYNGYEGWCKAVYITKDPPQAEQTDTPEPAQTETDYVQPDHYLEYPNHCETIVGELNLRSGPGEGYHSYLTMPKGAQLEELGYNDNNSDWIFTCYNGQYGWAKTMNNGKLYIEFSGGMAKPVIYIYPETETVVDVKLSLHTSDLSTTYPRYEDGWKVIAKPNGSLTNLADGTQHSYLFWDSCNDRTHYDFSEGFCVSGADTEAFLKEKLTFMGLTESEMNDFIVYWLPKMEHNKYNLISFQKDAYTEAAELTVSPKPDSILRVFMAYIPLENEVEITPQKLETFERNGYTLVEWGGTERN